MHYTRRFICILKTPSNKHIDDISNGIIFYNYYTMYYKTILYKYVLYILSTIEVLYLYYT